MYNLAVASRFAATRRPPGRAFVRPTEERWTPSTGAAVFRPGKDLAEAFRRDVARLELDRRLRQIELEHLLLRRTDQTPSPTATTIPIVPIERLEASLEQLLRQGNSKLTAVGISEQLANVLRPGPIMGPLLEELAFDTAVDLDRVREVMLQIWNAYHPEVVGATKPDAEAAEEPTASLLDPGQVPGETLGERLVRTLDEGLRQKVDVDDLFAHLERLAGLEPGTSDSGENPFDLQDDGDEETEPAGPDPGGDLGPLVQEFLWENGIEEEPLRRRCSAGRPAAKLRARAHRPRTCDQQGPHAAPAACLPRPSAGPARGGRSHGVCSLAAVLRVGGDDV